MSSRGQVWWSTLTLSLILSVSASAQGQETAGQSSGRNRR